MSPWMGRGTTSPTVYTLLTFHDGGDDLRPDAELRPPALHRDQPVGFLDRADDAVSVQRSDAAEIDHLRRKWPPAQPTISG